MNVQKRAGRSPVRTWFTKLGLLVSSAVLLFGCGSALESSQAAGEMWRPTPGTSWQWQLSTQVGTPLDVDAYDVDGFDSSARTVNRLHDNGSKAICYLSVGSWENWRPDKNKFPRRVLGNNYDGWPGEKWLDIRRLGVLGPIMGARMDMCKQKGFDAIEPDNMDGYTNRTGFELTAADQLRYNRWLARAAHERGLAIAMKNDQDQVNALVSDYDFAITEDCFDQGWCNRMSPFVQQDKAVLAAEYTDTGARLAKFCPKARNLNFDAILKKRNLDAWRRSC
jgi:hypothetical protein